MLDLQLTATELEMHEPNVVACEDNSDPLWISKHETWFYPVIEKAPIGLRFIAQKISQVKQIPHHDCWIVWSREPKLWHDSAHLTISDPVDEYRLLREWSKFSIHRRQMMRTVDSVLKVWPEWIKSEEWFDGKQDPTCLT